MIRKLLVANRGEIACRIMRSAQRMGIECAAIYSDADSHARHVRMADTAFRVGTAESRDSYLNMQRIVDIAVHWGADAIHPGYGFLSENSRFAALVGDAGIRFVGPRAEAIAAMGSKEQAKTLMEQAGVATVPGYHGDEQDPALLRGKADELGYPLLIKAVAGGGGRGLRVVHDGTAFDQALVSVRREAEGAFGNSSVLLEKYLPNARHVEVQVFADHHGQCLHLFERDCSVQRRHQKLIEEAPAPGIDESLRKEMGEAAVRAAKAIDYRGAGTVEFLLQDRSFWFMEMNTRLQVEHPVTEAITGLDLVEWQLRVASGEALPLKQQDIRYNGWAIEARINAEKPQQGFLPSSGRIARLHWPDADSLRFDSGFAAGDRISIHYDSLLAKLIIHAPQRGAAIRGLSRALQHSLIEGVETNRQFLSVILDDAAFQHGGVHSAWLEQEQERLLETLRDRQFLASLDSNDPGPGAATHGRWQALEAWRSVTHNHFSRRYHLRREPAPGHGEINHRDNADRVDHLSAPLPGRILAVQINEGDEVEKGQVLLVMEAMKMEHAIAATDAAVIRKVCCQAGQLVQPDDILVEFGPEQTMRVNP